MFISLCIFIFIFPATTAGCEIFSSLAILFFVLKKISVGANAMKGCVSSAASCDARIKALRLPFSSFSVELPLIVFVGACALSIFFSQDIALSLRAFIGKTLQTALLCMVVQQSLISPRRVRVFLKIFAWSAAIVCLDAFWQWRYGVDLLRHAATDVGRLAGPMRHSNDLGNYLLVFIIPLVVFTFGLVVKAFKERVRTSFVSSGIWVVLMMMVMVTMGLTYSRGAWLGLVCGVVIFVMFQPRKWKPLLLGTVIFLGLFMPLMPQSRGDIFNEQANGMALTSSFLNTSSRNFYWHDGWRIFSDHPIMGTGLNTYTEVIKKYAVTNQNYAHNCYLQMAAETGIIGLGAFLWFVIAVILVSASRIRKVRDDLTRSILFAFLAGWCGVLAQSFVDTTLYSSQLAAIFWTMAGFLIVVPSVFQGEGEDKVLLKP